MVVLYSTVLFSICQEAITSLTKYLIISIQTYTVQHNYTCHLHFTPLYSYRTPVLLYKLRDFKDFIEPTYSIKHKNSYNSSILPQLHTVYSTIKNIIKYVKILLKHIIYKKTNQPTPLAYSPQFFSKLLRGLTLLYSYKHIFTKVHVKNNKVTLFFKNQLQVWRVGAVNHLGRVLQTETGTGDQAGSGLSVDYATRHDVNCSYLKKSCIPKRTILSNVHFSVLQCYSYFPILINEAGFL